MLIPKILTILIFIFLLSLTGILIFLKGFLLSRSVIESKSECLVEFALRAEDNHSHHAKGCWMHSRFKRAIIVLIDALKYDFMEYNESLGTDDRNDLYFKNKLPILHQLQMTKPLNTRLYKFIADPPTTTMQRLKGLTTGSLPTFVDAGANFKSYDITEDTFIEQLVRQNKKIKFLGDDTWLGLFPNKFYKSFGFPSFNIRDLHSVDDGILSNIYPEIKKLDWDVLITHFLGVDHCGHRYGPNYPAMQDKLLQMNTFLSNITKLMEDDWILFVMGDHGMTSTGDHGGDSRAELEAGLFIYSPTQIASSSQLKNEDNVVRQVDFTPTISLLLGLPIPFSNLGMVITDLFTYCPWWNTASNDIRQAYHKIKALRLNAHQISNYLSAYQTQASDLPVKELRNLQQLFTKSEQEIQSYITLMTKDGVNSDTLSKFKFLENSYKVFIRDTRQICENVWAKFDLKFIFMGILTMVVGLSQSFYFLMSWTNDEEVLPVSAKFLLGGSFIYLLSLAVHLFIFPTAVPLMPVMLAAAVVLANCICVKSELSKNLAAKRYLTLENVASSVLLAINCCLYFSNSFVVYEDDISIFLLQTLVCIFGVNILFAKTSPGKGNLKAEFAKHLKKSKSNFDILQAVLHPRTVCVVACLACCCLLRISSSFIPCREEQISCVNSVFSQPLASLEGATKNKRYIFSVVTLTAMVYASRRWLKHFGNLNGTSPGVVSMHYGPPLAALFACLHWALQGLSDLDSVSFTPWQLALMAQAVYVVTIVSIVTVMIWPLLIFMLPPISGSSIQLTHKADLQHIIPTIYNQLKVSFNQSERDEKAPVVYGLGSAYTAAVCALLVLFSLLLALLLNDGTSPSLLFGMLVVYLCLELYSASIASQSKHEDVAAQPSWAGLVLLSFLSTVFFYVTGHQATVPSIRFEAAYVGFYGDFNSYILPGFLVWLNTFAGPIFINLAGPLLIFWPLLSSGLSSHLVDKKREQLKGKTPWLGDFSLFNNGIQLNKNMFSLVCGTIFIASIKLIFAALAAALHRRHLMVWKIFAPRLVCESAMFVTVSACMFVAYLFVLRIDSAMFKFVNKIHPDKDK